jgi:hypothetical protein
MNSTELEAVGPNIVSWLRPPLKHPHGAGGIWPIDKPASTLLGVSCLARDDMLYEVDVQALIPH